VAGKAARGVVFGVAAVSFDPEKAQGLNGPLRKIATIPLGPWLLVRVPRAFGTGSTVRIPASAWIA
jgi:hypothetical protein